MSIRVVRLLARASSGGSRGQWAGATPSDTELSATETWATFHPLDDAPVPPPGRLFTQSPRYIDQLQAAGLLHSPAPQRDALAYPDPTAPPAHVIERSGP